jgi:hypothetical protein
LSLWPRWRAGFGADTDYLASPQQSQFVISSTLPGLDTGARLPVMLSLSSSFF